MKIVAKKLAFAICLLFSMSLMVYDSWPHFDKSLIQLKRDHRSAQRNWNLFYGQRFVYYDSAVRYTEDLSEIEKIIQPNSLVLSDYATSYYISSRLPLYVRNIHRHHGRSKSKTWDKMLDSRSLCYLNDEKQFGRFDDFLIAERASNKESEPIFRYVILNNDELNRNLRYDCLWNNRAVFSENIERLTVIKYQGEFISLYELP